MNDKDPDIDDETIRLVEYLDGESDPPTSERVEGEIARSPAVRKEIESLQRAWDLLDFLPMPSAKPQFRQRTVEIATQSLVSTDLRRVQVRRWPALLLWTAAIAAAFLIGAVAAFRTPNDDQEMIQNQALLENLDDYRAVGNIEFLDLLQEEKLDDQIRNFLEPTQ